jgi:outer membrane autotransporter protein
MLPTPGLPNYRNEVPVYLAMPELANELGFAMIDNADARLGWGREEFTPPPPGFRAEFAPCESVSEADAQKAIQSGDECATPSERAKLDALERADADDAIRNNLMWGRVLGATGEQQPGGAASLSSATPFLNSKGPQYSASYGGFEAGVDLWRQTSREGARDAAGLFIGYLAAFADVDQVYSSARAGTVTMNAYSGGAYWTHFAPEGWYIDSVLQGTWFGQAHGGANATGMSVSGSALTASIEAGDPFRIAPTWTIEPQAQAIYQYAALGSGQDAYGQTSFGATDDFRARIGAKASYVAQNGANGAGLPVTFWGRVNIWRDFIANPPAATFATLSGLDPTTLDGALEGTWGEIDAGVNARVTKILSLTGSAFYDHSIDGGATWSLGGRIGLKLEF